jgi:hypothetical protein
VAPVADLCPRLERDRPKGRVVQISCVSCSNSRHLEYQSARSKRDQERRLGHSPANYTLSHFAAESRDECLLPCRKALFGGEKTEHLRQQSESHHSAALRVAKLPTSGSSSPSDLFS